MEQRQRSRAEEEQTTEEEIAAAIAALLGGIVAVQTVEALVGAIASLLARLPGLPESGLGDDVTRRVARLVVEDRPSEAAFREGSSSATLRSTHVDNLIHRAHYAINATKRVISADDTRKAFTQERRHFMAHRDAERRRTAGARMVDAAIELHGPILGWRHGHPREPRPAHAAADGRNFDARTIPISTGALPGVLPNCTCTVTAPFPKARILN